MASFADLIFGAKPKVAPYTPTEFGPEQIKALKENIDAMPWISQLGDLYQTYMTDAFNTAIPGFSDILAMGGKLTQKMQATAGEELAGQIPKDVQETVQRSSAFQNLLSGGGGGMADANAARNYGLTSLDMIGKGAALQQEAGNAAQRWAGLASNLVMNPAGYLVTPQQQVQLTMSNNLHKQATKQLQNNVDAAPNPGLQALNQWLEQLGGTIVASYAGGGMGGGKGGGDYKTTYNPSSYLGSSGQSSTGDGVVNFGGNTGAPSGNLWDAGVNPNPYTDAASFSTGSVDLWGSYNPGANTTSSPNFAADMLAVGSPTGTTDFYGNTPQTTSLWNTSGVPQGYNPYNFG